MVRTVIEAVNWCDTLPRQFLIHPLMEAHHISFLIVAPRHTALIGDHHHQIALPVAVGDSLHRLRHPLEILYPVQVMHIHIQGAIPVKKNCFLQTMPPHLP